mmetsp:Transcript_1178/g.3275  ORF Transcript_1178/g.3275 Transcript_1178/m.3275 type:complete len:210 (-) Transcript_1178:536-1165(-)
MALVKEQIEQRKISGTQAESGGELPARISGIAVPVQEMESHYVVRVACPSCPLHMTGRDELDLWVQVVPRGYIIKVKFILKCDPLTSSQEGTHCLLVVFISMLVHPCQKLQEPCACCNGCSEEDYPTANAINSEGARDEYVGLLRISYDGWDSRLEEKDIEIQPKDIQIVLEQDQRQCELVEDGWRAREAIPLYRYTLDQRLLIKAEDQ